MSDEPQPPVTSARKTAVAQPMTLDEKRARQRAYVKKSYYRQQNTVNALKQQLWQLEVEYRRLKRAVVVSEPAALAAAVKRFPAELGEEDEQPFIFKREQVGTNDADNDGEATTVLTSAYAQLTLLKEELRKENRVLARNVREHERFQQYVNKCVAVDKASNAPSSGGGASTSASAQTRRRPPPVLIKLFTVDECQTITAKCYAEAVAISQSSDFESSGVSAFGWRDERRVFDGGRFNFSIKKFFFGRTATQLSQDSWWFSATPRLKEMYPSQMDVELHVMQEVDADSVIMYRVIHSLDGSFADKTLLMTTRFRIDSGYAILFQSLEPEGRLADAEVESEGESPPVMDDFRSQHKQERWRRLQTWVFFEEAGENAEHCLYYFGGAVPTNSAVWMLEILLIALRWESIVVGPVFSISC